jgi:outer membrane lipoprotein-sorting protein
MKKLFITFAFFALFGTLMAQDAIKLIDEAENSIKGDSMTGSFTMNVVTPDYSRTMKMDSWWVGTEKALIVITAPAKDAGNKTLKIGNEMWNYLKNTETTMKVPPSMMLQSWNGSDLTNDDLVRESKLSRDYDCKVMFEEQISGKDCYKIELIPKPDAPVVWGHIYYWLSKEDKLPILVQYYSEKGKLIRTMKFSDIKTMDGRKIPTKWTVISETKPGHYTEFVYDKVKFDVKIPTRTFSKRELEK